MLAALALGAVAFHLQADTITQTVSVASHVPAGNYVLTFDKFDTNLGTLDSIQIILSLSMYGGAMALDNDSPLPIDGTGSFGTGAQLSSSDVNLKLRNASSDENVWVQSATVSHYFNLAADDGDGEGYQAGGTDWDSFSGPIYDQRVTQSVSDYVASAYFEAYQTAGDGTYNITYISDQVTQLLSGGVAYSGSPASAEGYVTVIYNYTVPEPTTGTLAGLAGLMLLRRRRRV